MTPHGTGPEVEPGASERLRDAHLAHQRNGRPQALDDDPHEVGEPIDRLGNAKEGMLPLFVDSMHPRSDRRGRQPEPLGHPARASNRERREG